MKESEFDCAPKESRMSTDAITRASNPAQNEDGSTISEALVMRHGRYTTSKPITMTELFDGRLGLYGIFEWDAWQFFADTYENAIPAGFDPCSRCLTTFLCCDYNCEHNDDEGNCVWVNADNENTAVTFSVYLSKNNPSTIFSAITKAFGVEICIEAVKTCHEK